MDIGKEREPRLNIPDNQDVSEHIDDIPEEIEAHEGVKRTVSQFGAKVTDDSGNNIIQSQANQNITITIPTDDSTLQSQSKGNADDSSTWLAVFFKRLLLKAKYFGWNVFRGNDAVDKTNLQK